MLQLTNPQETFKFIAFLEEGLNFVDAWTPTEINSGGCGEFALLFSNELDKYGIKHSINGVQDKDDVKKKVFDHFVIKIDNLFFDCNGLVQNCILHSGVTVKEIPKSELERLVRDKNYWNPVYDHDCDNFIQDKLDFIFGQYDTFKAGDFKFPKKDEVKFTKHTKETRMKYMGGMMPPGLMNMLMSSQRQ